MQQARRGLIALTVLGGLAILPFASAQTARPTTPVYRACPQDKVWSDVQGGCVCGTGLRWDESVRRCTATCPPGKVQVANAAPGTCAPLPRTCPPGKRWSEQHDGCVVVCPAGKAADAKGTGCIADTKNCPADTQWYESRGACLPFCAPGKSLDYVNGTCVDDPVGCAAGSMWSSVTKACVSVTAPAPPPISSASASSSSRARPPPRPEGPRLARSARALSQEARDGGAPKACPEGKEWKDAFNNCVPICPPDQVLDFYGVACHLIRPRR